MHNIVEISDASNIWNFIFLLIGNLICIYELGTHLDDDFIYDGNLKFDSLKEPVFAVM